MSDTSGPLFSVRKRLADEALANHPQAGDWSERDRTIFRAGAMMGVTRGYALAADVPPLPNRAVLARLVEVTIGLGLEPAPGCSLCMRGEPICPIHYGQAIADAILTGATS